MGGKRVELTATEFKLLHFLARGPAGSLRGNRYSTAYTATIML